MTNKNVATGNLEQLNGNIIMAPETIETIAAIAVKDVRGVRHLNGAIMDGVTEFFSRNQAKSNGVYLSGTSDHLVIDLYCTVVYGYPIPQVALEIQEKIKEQVLYSCDLVISEVNVHIVKIVSEDQKEENILNEIGVN
ncbi:MAG: Asp23/Gls24 family envelope stress response protein [Bavariicoccus seileri]|uniref:Asp23/Gls24 family envelope stress response protein n=1 Tax=Bavariicoccus seileri TaxID=549685 RepID=UPI003F8E0F99